MKNSVRNLILIAATDPQAAAAARAAVLDLARAKDPQGPTEDDQRRVVFTVEWEPAFKDCKELSAKFKDVSLTLYAEAFAQQHWVSKTVYQAGKALEDATLSRIDGKAFQQVYQEIFNQPYAG